MYQDLMCMQISMCLDEMVPMEDHMEDLVVVDVFESCPCVCMYIRLCWNKHEKRNILTSYAWKRADDTGGKIPIFLICRGEVVSEGCHRPDFFELTILDFLSYLLPTLWDYNRS